MKAVFLILGCGMLLLGASVTEPATKTPFEDTLTLPQGKVALTGVDVRTKYFVKVYAIGHYGSGQAPAGADPARLLDYWSNANALKVFDLKFVYEVSAKKIRGAWEEGLDNAGYKGASREPLLAAFQTDIKVGSDLQFIGLADGTLAVQLDGKSLGEWKDPALVKAIWQIWMGKNSPLGDKNNLVKLPATK